MAGEFTVISNVATTSGTTGSTSRPTSTSAVYTLAGLEDPVRGRGLKDDTLNALARWRGWARRRGSTWATGTWPHTSSTGQLCPWEEAGGDHRGDVRQARREAERDTVHRRQAGDLRYDEDGGDAPPRVLGEEPGRAGGRGGRVQGRGGSEGREGRDRGAGSRREDRLLPREPRDEHPPDPRRRRAKAGHSARSKGEEAAALRS